MYKSELKEEMVKLISEFFQIEQNNRVTSFNMDGLLLKIGSLFANHEMPDSVKDTKEKENA